jgi:hypothetical protein
MATAARRKPAPVTVRTKPVEATTSQPVARKRRTDLTVVESTKKAPAKAAAKAPSKPKPEHHALPNIFAGAQTALEQQIYGMAVEHVQCRDFGHSWRPFSARWLPADNCFEQILRCQRCTTTRTRHLGSRGQQLDSSYDYVEGYTVKGMGRLSGTDRDVIRLASVRSILVTDTVEE